MNTKNKKIIYAIISMLIFLFIVVLIIIITKNKTTNDNTYIDENGNVVQDEPQGDEEAIMNYEKEKLINTTYFFSIEKYINDYLDAINLKSAAEVFDVLDEDFIKENNFTKENVIANIEPSYDFLAMEIYETRQGSLYSYVVRGVEDDEIYNKEKYYIFYLDLFNFTYKIKPLYNKSYNSIQDINIANNLSDIKNNGNNSFKYINLNNASIVTKYVKYYVNLLKNNPEKAYNMLEKNYKKERFQNSYNNFKYYTTKMNNSNKFDINLKSVSQGTTDNKISYFIKTEKDNRYNIIQNGPMDFYIQLDEYTLVTDSFREKYNKTTDIQKVSTDVDKVMKMINTYDYVGLYNLLDEVDKANNFSDINSLIGYISNNFYNSNIYEIKDIKVQNNIYIAEIKVYMDNEKNTENANIKILVQLGEDTDFKISFS